MGEKCFKVGINFAKRIESTSFLTPKIKELVPSRISNVKSLGIFKEKSNFWATDESPHRLCKRYIGNISFV